MSVLNERNSGIPYINNYIIDRSLQSIALTRPLPPFEDTHTPGTAIAIWSMLSSRIGVMHLLAVTSRHNDVTDNHLYPVIKPKFH